MSHRIRLRFLFLGMTFFWLLLYSIISPEFGGIDIQIFKEAGANLALGKGFVASLLPGSPDPTPHLFSSYLPLYPLLFGIYSKAIGVGAYQNTFFNFILAWTCAVLWFQLIQLFFKSWQGSLSSYLFVFILSLLIPTGMLGVARDRPETLSLVFLLGSLLLSTQKLTVRKWTAIFLLCGLSGITSPFGALLHLLCLLIIHRKRIFRLDNLKETFLAFFYSALPLLCVVLIYTLLDPNAFKRFLEHGTQSGSGLSVVLKIFQTGGISGYFHILFDSFASKSPQPLGINLSYLVALFLLPSYFLFKFIKHKNHEYFKNWIFFLAIGFFPIIFFPTQGNYLAFTRDVLLAGMFYYGIRDERVTKTLIRILTVLLIAIFLSQAPLLARDIAIRSTNKASYQRALLTAKNLSTFFKHSSDLHPVGVWPAQYFIFKDKVELIDLYWLPPQYKFIPRFLAFGYAESGDLYKPIIPKPFLLPDRPNIVYEPKLPQPTEVFGRRISKSSNTWESLILENWE